VDTLGKRAEGRTGTEDNKPPEENFLAAGQIGQAAEGEQQAGDGQQIRQNHPLRQSQIGIKGGHDVWQADVDDAGI
jgi:hypothetical protein